MILDYPYEKQETEPKHAERQRGVMWPQAQGRLEPQELGEAGRVPPGPEGQERCQHRDSHVWPLVRCFKPSTLCHWPHSPGTPVHVDACMPQGWPRPPLGEGQERVQTGSGSQAPGTEVRVMRRRKGQGLSHSLRRLALHTDEARPHKPDLARGRVPAQAPGQAGHLSAQDLNVVAASEGHLFGP